MPPVRSKTVQIECRSCSGTGIYIGWAEVETEGLGVKCINCKGSGAYEAAASMTAGRKPYTGRKVRKGITRVQLEMGGRMGYNPNPPTILTYRQFRRQFPAAKVST